MIFGDYEFPATSSFGKNIKSTLDEVIRDYFALYCWSNGIPAPTEGTDWDGLNDEHKGKFQKIIFQIVSEQPFTIPFTNDKWGTITLHFQYLEDGEDNLFIIKEGSVIRQRVTTSYTKKNPSGAQIRSDWREDATLVNHTLDGREEGLQFTKDSEFKGSASPFGALIKGTVVSGTDHIDFGEWIFGSQKNTHKKLEDGELPDETTFIGWLLHPQLAQFGVIPEKIPEE